MHTCSNCRAIHRARGCPATSGSMKAAVADASADRADPFGHVELIEILAIPHEKAVSTENSLQHMFDSDDSHGVDCNKDSLSLSPMCSPPEAGSCCRRCACRRSSGDIGGKSCPPPCHRLVDQWSCSHPQRVPCKSGLQSSGLSVP